VEDQSSLLQSTMQEDSFEVVMRGYNKRQVDDYVLQCQHHIRDLAQRLALAEQEIERVRADAALAIEKASSKPVHEEVSERLAQILRLANEEAERERANAADEIAALRAAALADTQNLREQAQRETEELRQQALAETDAKRDQVKAETEALREHVNAETDALRHQAEQEAADERQKAQDEADRLLGEAQAAAERDVAQARSQAQQLEDSARTESEQLVRVAQERADSVIGEAERRANAINTVLGGRLEVLTATHKDVVARLVDLRTVLVDVLGKEESEAPFEVPPSPAETMAVGTGPLPVMSDPYVQTAGEVAAAYEAAQQDRTPTWRSSVHGDTAGIVLDGGASDDDENQVIALDAEPVAAVATPAVEEPATVTTAERRLDLSSVAEKTRR
jgi:cell division septum initiation protein DivIVA